LYFHRIPFVKVPLGASAILSPGRIGVRLYSDQSAVLSAVGIAKVEAIDKWLVLQPPATGGQTMYQNIGWSLRAVGLVLAFLVKCSSQELSARRKAAVCGDVFRFRGKQLSPGM
jgi:hypothetical protein